MVNWSWWVDGNVLVPVTTDEAAADDELLGVVRCRSQNPCGGSRCSCCNNGLKCVPACGDCRCAGSQNLEKTDISCDSVPQDEIGNGHSLGCDHICFNNF